MLLKVLWLVAAVSALAASQNSSTGTTFEDYDSVHGVDKRWSTCRPSPDVSLYDFNHTLIDGSAVRNLTAYKGEVVVVTNVASY